MAEWIVRKALDLLMEMPSAPAMRILDLAMEGTAGQDVSFENLDPRTRHLWSDHTDPPAPFAELVRRAFAPQLDPHVWMLLAEGAPPASDLAATSGALNAWQDALR